MNNEFSVIFTAIDKLSIEAATPEMIEGFKQTLDKEDMLSKLIDIFNLNSNTNKVEIKEALTDMLLEASEEYQPESEVKQQIKEVVLEQMLNLISESYALSVANADCVVNFELLVPEAKLPTYAHSSDAGADIYAVETQTIKARTYGNFVHTGLKMEMQPGWEMQIRARSGMSRKTPLRLSNAVATIDSAYRGEVGILFDNISDEDYTINVGDRIAQFVIAKSYRFDGKQVDKVNEVTDRGTGGFGASGK